MSSVYNLEPPPTAKVLIRTTAGDILLELFAKQAPLASRNFLQLCLDGYYDNTVFHRLVPGFIIQGGDPTGTGSGGESSFDGGEPFADEFHSRLKFNRRGLLGMANTGEKNDNGSQFFLTLGVTPELTGKNTMFGRVVGDTIYNLMKMGEAELVDEGSDRPLYPNKVLGAEILVNPFEGMGKKAEPELTTSVEEKKVKKKPKRKAGKPLLSFGVDEGEEGDSLPVVKKVKYNPQIITSEEAPTNGHRSANKAMPPEGDGDKPIKKKDKPVSPPREATSIPKNTIASSLSAAAPYSRSRHQQSPSPELSKTALKARSPSPSPPSPPSKLERTNQEIDALKASMRRNTAYDDVGSTKQKSLLADLVPANTTRGRKRNGATNTKQERKAFEAFNAFRAKLESASFGGKSVEVGKASEPPHNGVENMDPKIANMEEDDDEEATLCDLHFITGCQSCLSWNERSENVIKDDDDVGWMGHALSFAKDRLGKDLEWKRKNEQELVVIDPKEKAKALGVEKVGMDQKKGERWGKVDERVMRRQ